jgi:hypothetical protein
MQDDVTNAPNAPATDPLLKGLRPKPTRKTDGFKIMLASWLLTVAVTQLNKRHILIPDFFQDYMRDVLVTVIDSGMFAISGWLTHLVVKSSLARNVVNTQAAHGTPTDLNVAKMEVTQK